jgi:hypothetical protein
MIQRIGRNFKYSLMLNTEIKSNEIYHKQGMRMVCFFKV